MGWNVSGQLEDFLGRELSTIAHHLDANAALEPREVPRGFPPKENGGDVPAKGDLLTTTAQRHIPWELGSIGWALGDPERPR